MSVDYNDKNYDYISYWGNRSYEHNSEVIALKKLLPKKGKRIIDIGAGFGRLFPVYESRFKEIILFEPSKKLLEQARDNINKSTIDKVFFRIGKIPIRDRPNLGLSLIEYDCVLMVRVVHHLEDLNSAIASVSKIIKKDGVFILEFANKIHFLNILKNSARLNFGFFFTQPYKVGTFILWHPAYVKEVLEKNGFALEKKLSVSNFRSSLLKKLIPEKILLVLEDCLQKPLSYINFGPSVFVKAVKS